MGRIDRILTNVLVKDLSKSKEFYTSLFDFKISYDSDWFVHMVSKEKELEFALIDSVHHIVPKDINIVQGGSYMTFVVDDVDLVLEEAKRMDFEIVHLPEATFYGQRRMLLRDPDGNIIDVSSLIVNNRR